MCICGALKIVTGIYIPIYRLREGAKVPARDKYNWENYNERHAFRLVSWQKA